jgi:hypothetical protein
MRSRSVRSPAKRLLQALETFRRGTQMMDQVLEQPIWQLLLEEPEDLTSEACFAIIDYYLETLGDQPNALVSTIAPYLAHCPQWNLEKQLALYHVMVKRV